MCILIAVINVPVQMWTFDEAHSLPNHFMAMLPMDMEYIPEIITTDHQPDAPFRGNLVHLQKHHVFQAETPK